MSTARPYTLCTALAPPLTEGAFLFSVIPHNFDAKSLFTLPKINFPAQFLQGFSTHFACKAGINIPYSGIFLHKLPHVRKHRSTKRNAKLYKDTCKFSATPAIEKNCTPWYTKHDNYRALLGRARSAATHGKQEENYGKKRNRRSVRRSHFGHQRQPGGCV